MPAATNGSSSSSSALVATSSTKVLLEFCCSENSELGVQGCLEGWIVERLSLAFADLSTPEGLQKSVALAQSHIAAGSFVCLRGS